MDIEKLGKDSIISTSLQDGSFVKDEWSNGFRDKVVDHQQRLLGTPCFRRVFPNIPRGTPVEMSIWRSATGRRSVDIAYLQNGQYVLATAGDEAGWDPEFLENVRTILGEMEWSWTKLAMGATGMGVLALGLNALRGGEPQEQEMCAPETLMIGPPIVTPREGNCSRVDTPKTIPVVNVVDNQLPAKISVVNIVGNQADNATPLMIAPPPTKDTALSLPVLGQSTDKPKNLMAEPQISVVNIVGNQADNATPLMIASPPTKDTALSKNFTAAFPTSDSLHATVPVVNVEQIQNATNEFNCTDFESYFNANNSLNISVPTEYGDYLEYDHLSTQTNVDDLGYQEDYGLLNEMCWKNSSAFLPMSMKDSGNASMQMSALAGTRNETSNIFQGVGGGMPLLVLGTVAAFACAIIYRCCGRGRNVEHNMSEIFTQREPDNALMQRESFSESLREMSQLLQQANGTLHEILHVLTSVTERSVSSSRSIEHASTQTAPELQVREINEIPMSNALLERYDTLAQRMQQLSEAMEGLSKNVEELGSIPTNASLVSVLEQLSRQYEELLRLLASLQETRDSGASFGQFAGSLLATTESLQQQVNRLSDDLAALVPTLERNAQVRSETTNQSTRTDLAPQINEINELTSSILQLPDDINHGMRSNEAWQERTLAALERSENERNQLIASLEEQQRNTQELLKEQSERMTHALQEQSDALQETMQRLSDAIERLSNNAREPVIIHTDSPSAEELEQFRAQYEDLRNRASNSSVADEVEETKSYADESLDLAVPRIVPEVESDLEVALNGISAHAISNITFTKEEQQLLTENYLMTCIEDASVATAQGVPRTSIRMGSNVPSDLKLTFFAPSDTWRSKPFQGNGVAVSQKAFSMADRLLYNRLGRQAALAKFIQQFKLNKKTYSSELRKTLTQEFQAIKNADSNVQIRQLLTHRKLLDHIISDALAQKKLLPGKQNKSLIEIAPMISQLRGFYEQALGLSPSSANTL